MEETQTDRNDQRKRLSIDEIVGAFRALTLAKQGVVLETIGAGLSGETPEGLRVTARTRKELRRFTKNKDHHVIDWIRGFDPRDVFYDVGANCGGITLAAAALHRDRITIVAIEPSFSSFESLARNLSSTNMLGFVVPLQVALFDRTGVETLFYHSTAAGSSLHAVGAPVDYRGAEFDAVEKQIVPTFALDDLVTVLDLPAPTRVKIDVDGSEEPVLRGCVRMLAAGTIRDLFIEIVNHDGRDSRLRGISDLLARYGYTPGSVFEHPPALDSEVLVADYLFHRADSGRPISRPPSADHAPDRGDAAHVTALESMQHGLQAAEREREERRAAERRSGRERREAERLAVAAAEKARTKAAKTALKEARAAAAREAAAQKEARKRARVVGKEMREALRRQRKKIDIPTIPGFAEVAQLVKADGRLTMDYDRLYTLWQAVLSAPPDAPIVEVGAYQGRSAKFIAEAFRRRGQSPGFYVCDTFSGHPRVDEAIDLPVHTEGGKFLDTSKESVAEYLGSYSNIRLVVGDIVETARQLADEAKFGLVHIDVDVYPATDFCIRFFAPRLAAGALLVVDDYGYRTCPGVRKAVDDFVAGSAGFQMLHLLSGQAVLFRAAQ